MNGKVTEIKRISQLVIFYRNGGKVNRTYKLDTERKVRRIEQVVGDLLINSKAIAKHGSRGDRFNIIVTANIQRA